MLNKKILNLDYSLFFYILISLFSMNFFRFGSLICLLFGIFSLFLIKRFQFDFNCCVLVILTISIIIASLWFYDINEIIKGFNYFLMYIIGFNGFMEARNKILFLRKTLFAIFIGYSFYVMLLCVQNINIDISAGNRIAIDFWTKDFLSVTLIGLISSVVIGYSFYALFLQRGLLLKIYTVIALLSVFFINFQTATRTPIILFLIVFVLTWTVFLISNKKTNIKIVLIALLILILSLFLYDINIFGVKSFVLNSPLLDRFVENGIETSRIDIMKIHFEHMGEFLFGGHKTAEIFGKEAHNIIQQGYDLYGIIAFCAIVLLVTLTIKNVIKIIKRTNKTNIDYLFFSLYLAIFIQFLLEPVFTGYPILIWCFLLIHGMATAYLKSIEKISLYEKYN